MPLVILTSFKSAPLPPAGGTGSMVYGPTSGTRKFMHYDSATQTSTEVLTPPANSWLIGIARNGSTILAMFATSNPSIYTYRSANNGLTWSPVAQLTVTSYNSFFDPRSWYYGNDMLEYANGYFYTFNMYSTASYPNNYPRVLRSADDGITWSEIAAFRSAEDTNDWISQILTIGSHQGILYASDIDEWWYDSDTTLGSILYSSNNGVTWNPLKLSYDDYLYYTTGYSESASDGTTVLLPVSYASHELRGVTNIILKRGVGSTLTPVFDVVLDLGEGYEATLLNDIVSTGNNEFYCFTYINPIDEYTLSPPVIVSTDGGNTWTYTETQGLGAGYTYSGSIAGPKRTHYTGNGQIIRSTSTFTDWWGFSDPGKISFSNNYVDYLPIPGVNNVIKDSGFSCSADFVVVE